MLYAVIKNGKLVQLSKDAFYSPSVTRLTDEEVKKYLGYVPFIDNNNDIFQETINQI